MGQVAVLAGSRARTCRLRLEAPSPWRVRAPSGLHCRARAARAPRRRAGACPSRRRGRRCPSDIAPISLRSRCDSPLCASPLRSSSRSASGRCSRRRGGADSATLAAPRLATPAAWRHGLRPGLPCVLSSQASRPFMCAAVALRAQVAHSAPLNAQAALLATALGRGGEATARFEACRRVDPFRAAYYDHSMVRA